MSTKVWLVLVMAFGSGWVQAQSIWAPVPESQIPAEGTRYITAKTYATFALNTEELTSLLDVTAREFTPIAQASPTYLALPMADGSLQRFAIVESPIMAAGLMEKYPDVTTYSGVGIDDPTARVRFDWTPQGFHAMILSAEHGTTFIDPYRHLGSRSHYIVYKREDFKPVIPKHFECGVDGEAIAGESRGGARFGSCELRTYRLAISATGEYTAFHGGTVALAQAAQVTTMNRVNAIYERELSIRMVFVPNNDTLIYTNANTDPFTNGATGTMINQNQSLVTRLIGVNNFDIGHVFGTNSGGLAGLGVVCSSNRKASGVTGSGAPIGDPFDVDYVAHEMGHQFGANHTQNNNCNRNGGTAYEPGSGSTIMGYAGICAPNVQGNSDDHFHAVSLDEIGAYITSGGHTCPVLTPTGNNAPVINSTVPTSYNLPVNTPFFLAGSATDADGDPLTYAWEQYDNETATMPPSPNSTQGPNFRSFSPTLDSIRYFPRLQGLSSGAASQWEVLPAVARTMNFRLTVRDNNTAGGCTDDMFASASFTSSAGPFIVTQPNATLTWEAFTTQTVTWNVANTNLAPIACGTVDILLSTDGGLTFTTLLAAGVPNNGSASIQLPNVATTTARIMVRCAEASSPFFDISDQNFTINAITSGYALQSTQQTLTLCEGDTASLFFEALTVGGYNDPISLSLGNLPAAAAATFAASPLTPGNTSSVRIDAGTLPAGTYALTLEGASTSGTRSLPFTLTVLANTIAAPTIEAPTSGATNVSTFASLAWRQLAGVQRYTISIATDAAFTNVIEQSTGLTDTTYSIQNGLTENTTYYWRVRGENDCATAGAYTTASFTTLTCDLINSTNVPVIIPNSVSTVTSTLTYAGVGRISNLEVVGLQGLHNYIEDLRITLRSPSGTVVTLFDQICGGQNNFNISFSDAGQAAASIPCPPTNGQTYQSQTPLSAFKGEDPNGTWTLSITDSEAQDGGRLTNWGLRICAQNCAITGAMQAIDPSCAGSNTGTITASPTSGVAPYTYSWSTGANTASITNLNAGTYSVTVVDANGCFVELQSTLTDPAPLQVNSTITPASCRNADGQVELTFSAGTAPYSVRWNDGDTNRIRTNLVATSYSVLVTDAKGCTKREFITMTAVPSIPNIGVEGLRSPSCAGDSDGSIRIRVTPTNTNYTYAWSNGQTTEDNLQAAGGAHSVTVTNNGCSSTRQFTLNEPDTLVIQANINDASTPTAADGQVEVLVTGGRAPYTFNWSQGATSSTVSGLAQGSYTVTITDANGCERIEQYNVRNLLTSTSSASATSIFTLFPNPNQGQFTVQVEQLQSETAQLEIYDVLGRRVYQQTLSAAQTSLPIDLRHLSAGTYIATLQHATHKQHIQFIVR